jgi:hypothetical protein
LTIKNTRIVITISHNGIDNRWASDFSSVKLDNYEKQCSLVNLKEKSNGQEESSEEDSQEEDSQEGNEEDSKEEGREEEIGRPIH